MTRAKRKREDAHRPRSGGKSRPRYPNPQCQEVLDTAYGHVKTLLVDYGDPILTTHLVTGGDAVVSAWIQQATEQAMRGHHQACLESLRGWYCAIKSHVEAHATAVAEERTFDL